MPEPLLRCRRKAIQGPLDRLGPGPKNDGVSAINAKVIEELRALEAGGAPGLLKELIELFLGEAEVHMRTLKQSFAVRDLQLFERSAHTLKGSSGNLGALAMSHLCDELQYVARSADWTRASELLPGLDAEYCEVRTELEAEKGRS